MENWDELWNGYGNEVSNGNFYVEVGSASSFKLTEYCVTYRILSYRELTSKETYETKSGYRSRSCHLKESRKRSVELGFVLFELLRRIETMA